MDSFGRWTSILRALALHRTPNPTLGYRGNRSSKTYEKKKKGKGKKSSLLKRKGGPKLLQSNALKRRFLKLTSQKNKKKPKNNVQT